MSSLEGAFPKFYNPMQLLQVKSTCGSQSYYHKRITLGLANPIQSQGLK